jgi:hypothetical protein
VEENSTAEGLVAPDDLADARMIQADQLADFAERQPVLLRLREGLRRACRAALLSRSNCFCAALTALAEALRWGSAGIDRS